MGYMGSHLEDYYPHELLKEVVRQLKERDSLPEKEFELMLEELLDNEIVVLLQERSRLKDRKENEKRRKKILKEFKL
jgi:hypothetical protein